MKTLKEIRAGLQSIVNPQLKMTQRELAYWVGMPSESFRHAEKRGTYSVTLKVQRFLLIKDCEGCLGKLRDFNDGLAVLEKPGKQLTQEEMEKELCI